MQAWWAERGVYERLRAREDGAAFTLHDGPPYANGDLHIGHALNKILKDFVNRWEMMNGKRVRYVPGWDCHGLPIELKVLQSMDAEARKALTPIKLRYKAKAFAMKTVASQREQFKRYGIWADWDEPYMTLLPEYEAAQLEVFGKMFLNGHIYRGKKPVHWSPSSMTALAEAELEYPEGHVSQSHLRPISGERRSRVDAERAQGASRRRVFGGLDHDAVDHARERRGGGERQARLLRLSSGIDGSDARRRRRFTRSRGEQVGNHAHDAGHVQGSRLRERAVSAPVLRTQVSR